MNANPRNYEQHKMTFAGDTFSGKLLIILFNRCILHVQKTKPALRCNELEEAAEQIAKAQQLILELMSVMDISSDAGRRLLVVYEYIYNQMEEAGNQNDIDLLNEVESFLIDLRDLWVSSICT